MDSPLNCSEVASSVSESPGYVPCGFRTQAQLLYLRHRQFFRLLTECKETVSEMDALLYPSGQPVGGQTAVIAIASSEDLETLPFLLPSEVGSLPQCTGSLLSALTGNTGKLRAANLFILDKLDITETLRDSFVSARDEIGIDSERCDRETRNFESRFGYLIGNLDGSMQHISRTVGALLTTNEQGLETLLLPSSSEISKVLLQYLYWVSSSYLNCLCKAGAVKSVLEKGSVRMLRVAGVGTGVEYICNTSVRLATVLNWYRDKCLEQVVSLVSDEVLRLRLRQDLAEITHFK